MKNDHTIMETVILRMVTFFAFLAILFPAYFLFGLVTGVYGICAFAPEWWENIYRKLYILIPVIAIIAGIAVGKFIDKKSQEQ